MRRTLTVLVTTAAFVLPAAAASADTHTNASCNNGKGGNYLKTLHSYNGKGHIAVADTLECPARTLPGSGTGSGNETLPSNPFVAN